MSFNFTVEVMGKTESRRKRGQQGMRWLDSSMDMSLSKVQEMVKDRKSGVLQFIGLQRVGQDLATEQRNLFLIGKNV